MPDAARPPDPAPAAATGPAETYTTGDLARLTGNTLRAVRHYEAEGLVRPIRRGSRGERLFDSGQLECLRFVTDMRALSFSLASIRELLQASSEAESPARVADQIIPQLENRIDELRTRLQTLRRLRDDLVRARETAEECRACPHDWSSQRCPVCEDERGGDTPPLLHLLWQRRTT